MPEITFAKRRRSHSLGGDLLDKMHHRRRVSLCLPDYVKENRTTKPIAMLCNLKTLCIRRFVRVCISYESCRRSAVLFHEVVQCHGPPPGNHLKLSSHSSTRPVSSQFLSSFSSSPESRPRRSSSSSSSKQTKHHTFPSGPTSLQHFLHTTFPLNPLPFLQADRASLSLSLEISPEFPPERHPSASHTRIQM